MQISDLYQTKITCTTYNASIDSTDTVITVKLVDFNGAAVTNKSVTLTCDKGYFNKKGSTAISGTTTKSITQTTNSSGEITGTWTASEWGLCTFSANTDSIQVNVTGWKTYINNSNYKVYYNDELVYFRFNYSTGSGSITTAWTEFDAGIFADTFIRPTNMIFFFVGNLAIGNVRTDNSKFRIKSVSGNLSGTFTGEAIWKRR